jgi:NodT family efflux transporter outer membrane factor (OMF) lipoprotein
MTNATGRLAFVSLALVCLTACAETPKTVVRPANLPAKFDAATQSAHAPRAWWKSFNDPELDALEDEGLSSAPDARAAMARLEEAAAVRAQAMTAYDPKGSLTGSASDQHTTTGYSGLPASATSGGLASLFLPADETKTYSGAFNASWEVDLFGRRKAANRAARADMWAARFDFEASRLSLAANIASGLFQARALSVQLDDAEETRRIAQELAVVGQRKLEHGLSSGADAARLEADLAAASAEVTRLKAQSEAARRTLLALLGRAGDPVSSLKITNRLDAPPPAPGVTPAEMLMRRPDVREAEQRLRASIANLTLQKLALYPTFNLTPGGSISRQEANFVTRSDIWTLAANATLPVLDRPRLLAAVRQQKARADQAAIAYETAVQNAYRDAENGLRGMQADAERLALLTRAEERAHYAFTASERAYALGLVDLTTLLDAERSWRGARSALTALQAAALTDAVTTIKALGGGWDDPASAAKG